MSVQILRETIQRYAQAQKQAAIACKSKDKKPCRECVLKQLNLLRAEAQSSTPYLRFPATRSALTAIVHVLTKSQHQLLSVT